MAIRTDGDVSTSEFTHFVSIDFGTSGCGIAIATKENPKDIKLFTAWEGMNTDAKCPTVLLLDPSKEFVSFGYRAKTSYETKSSLPHPDKANDYLLFHKFKMHLYDNPDSEEIAAMNGKTVPLIEVFAHSLKYIREQALKELRNNFDNPGRKVQWILTVPAIWSPAAKQTMRRAARKAGFDEKSLVFALEPEAAALSCLQDLISIKNATKASYLVVDCGGGTVDIAAHKMIIDEKGEITIEELASPHGGNHGGFVVNEQFESMLQDLFGSAGTCDREAFKRIKEKHARQWMKMVWSDFEASKCSVKAGDTNATITVAVHKSIRKEVKEVTGKNIESLVEAFKKNDVKWDENEDSIVLPYSTICSLYRPALANITNLIDGVLSQCNVEMVLLVGGFAESSLLFDKVKESVVQRKSSIEVKRAPQPVFSVATGAVIFGLNKGVIKSRVMKSSIGVEACVEFCEGKHDQKYLKESGGEKYCEKAFWHLVKAKQSVYTGVPTEYLFRPLTEEQQTCVVAIYESPKEDVMYVDEVDCQPMGTIEIRVPKCTENESREIKLVIDFAKTEYTAMAFTGSGHKKELTVKPKFIHPNKYLPSSVKM